MSDTTTPEIRDTADTEDCSLEIACRLDNAKAIADLVQAATGSTLDGSDSKIDELATGTLHAAMYLLQLELEAVKELIPRQAEYDRKLAVERYKDKISFPRGRPEVARG